MTTLELTDREVMILCDCLKYTQDYVGSSSETYQDEIEGILNQIQEQKRFEETEGRGC